MLQETLEHQRPWVGYNRIYVFQELCFMILIGEKGQKHRTSLDISGAQLIELSFSHQASELGADVIHNPPLKKE